MSSQALTFTLLMLLLESQGQGSLHAVEHVVYRSGTSLNLKPLNTLKGIKSVRWKVLLSSENASCVMMKWNNKSKFYTDCAKKRFSNRIEFKEKDFALSIKSLQPQDSGLYTLETDDDSGKVNTSQFQVLIFDPVKEPQVQVESEDLIGDLCRVVLRCWVSGNDNVSIQWFRDGMSTQMWTPLQENGTFLEDELTLNKSYNFTCNVSNVVSWANHSLVLNSSCKVTWTLNLSFLSILAISLGVIVLVLGVISCLVWRRMRREKQLESNSEEVRTIYADVNNLKPRNNQQKPERNLPEDKKTIYSTVQNHRPHAPTPLPVESANTLYSLVQPSRKYGSRKKHASPPLNRTVYQEIGNGNPRLQKSCRLSRRELENFQIYS